MDKKRLAMSHICGAILAGGQGLRLGGEKAFALLGARPLIAWAVDTVSAQVEELVILGSDPRLARFNVPLLADAPDIEGPAGGLIAAVHYAKNQSAKGLLVVPCDMPFLPPDLVQQLQCDDNIGIPCVADRPNWAVSYWPAVALERASVTDHLAGGASLRKVMEACGYEALVQGDEAGFLGVNTPEALRRAQAQIDHQGGGL